jgi:cyclophilin family peptidyl-prolyl cis-trans isomerase
VAARAALALGRTGKLLAADPLLQHTQAEDNAIRAMVVYGLGLLARSYFIAQSGDRTSRGDGDAGDRIGAEENPLEQDAGVISMGLDYDENGPERDSAGSQFSITMSPQLHLDRDFTVFGRVENGFDVLGRIVESDRIIRIEEVNEDRRRYRFSLISTAARAKKSIRVLAGEKPKNPCNHVAGF